MRSDPPRRRRPPSSALLARLPNTGLPLPPGRRLLRPRRTLAAMAARTLADQPRTVTVCSPAAPRLPVSLLRSPLSSDEGRRPIPAATIVYAALVTRPSRCPHPCGRPASTEPASHPFISPGTESLSVRSGPDDPTPTCRRCASECSGRRWCSYACRRATLTEQPDLRPMRPARLEGLDGVLLHCLEIRQPAQHRLPYF